MKANRLSHGGGFFMFGCNTDDFGSAILSVVDAAWVL